MNMRSPTDIGEYAKALKNSLTQDMPKHYKGLYLKLLHHFALP